MLLAFKSIKAEAISPYIRHQRGEMLGQHWETLVQLPPLIEVDGPNLHRPKDCF